MKPKDIRRLTDTSDIRLGNVCTILKVRNIKSNHLFCGFLKNVDYTFDILTYSAHRLTKHGDFVFKDKYINFYKLMKVKNIYITIIKVDNVNGDYLETYFVKY